MDWIKGLINKITGRGDEITVVPGSKKDREKKEAGEFTDEIKDLLKEFLKSADINKHVAFFDPEESACYYYKLSEDGAELIKKVPIETYKKILPDLKSLNKKELQIGEQDYVCFLCIYLSDLGERISVLLFEKDNYMEKDVKEGKRKAIRLIKELKPPTALTCENIDHLIKVLEEKHKSTDKDIFALAEKEGLLEGETLEKLKSEGSIRKLLEQPIPRKQLLNVVAKWLEVEYYDVELNDLDEKLATSLPEEFAKKHRVIPAEKTTEDKIKVAFWNPFDRETIEKVKEHLGKDIVPVLACEEEIRNELDEQYHK